MDKYGHIAHQEGDVCYYIPRLFKYNSYYSGTEDVRIFVGDLKYPVTLLVSPKKRVGN